MEQIKKEFGLEVFQKRLEHHHDELRWLYMELISGNEIKPIGVNIPAYGFYYLKKKLL